MRGVPTRLHRAGIKTRYCFRVIYAHTSDGQRRLDRTIYFTANSCKEARVSLQKAIEAANRALKFEHYVYILDAAEFSHLMGRLKNCCRFIDRSITCVSVDEVGVNAYLWRMQLGRSESDCGGTYDSAYRIDNSGCCDPETASGTLNGVMRAISVL